MVAARSMDSCRARSSDRSLGRTRVRHVFNRADADIDTRQAVLLCAMARRDLHTDLWILGNDLGSGSSSSITSMATTLRLELRV